MGERSHPRVAILSYFVTQQPMWPPFVGKPVKNLALIITGLESGNDDASKAAGKYNIQQKSWKRSGIYAIG